MILLLTWIIVKNSVKIVWYLGKKLIPEKEKDDNNK